MISEPTKPSEDETLVTTKPRSEEPLLGGSWHCGAYVNKVLRTLVVGCETVVTAYEVRQYAARKLENEPAGLLLRPATAEEPPTIVIRWAGDDYAHGSSTAGRRMQERQPSTEGWVDV